MKLRFKALEAAEDRLSDLIRDENLARDAVRRAERDDNLYECDQARRRYADVCRRRRDQEQTVLLLGGEL